ncbi:MAG TPA: methylmalonyl Co-A mutase-associated GTPase MeaB [Candidatus Binatia bacterium]|nr:methylmalonyl Co-A mutase-associated GTPase MeaB [Candidatus Binatia bacterium]
MLARKLVERMLAGDKVALAKLMTLVENRHADTALVMSLVHDRCGHAYTIGLTGPPGAGKSTLVDRIVGALRAAGHRVGIVAVDPSSPFSGGAVLGDRIRMQSHFLDEGVFIRSLSSRGSHGGLARAARDVARLFDAASYDYVLIETVGVGQTELDVMRLADTTVVVLVPEAGDTVQAMKAGLLEIADVFVVNKADRDGAARMKSELEMMLQLRPAAAWAVPVTMTQGTSGDGVGELMAQIAHHRQFLAASGHGHARSAAGRREEFVAVLREEIARRLEDALDNGRFGPLLLQLKHGEIDPYRAAIEMLGSEETIRVIVQAGETGGRHR